MGCTGSKQERQGHWRSPAPLVRCHTMPVHHAALWKGDSCHVVSLMSTTLGSLRLGPVDHDRHHWGCRFCSDDDEGDDPMKKTMRDRKSGDFLAEGLKAKGRSETIKERVPPPRTPTETPRRDPEIIDAWEMMSGLENVSPLYQFSATGGPPVERSFSFHSLQDARRDVKLKVQTKKLFNGSISPEPMWMKMDIDGGGDSIITEFDPEDISSFREAMEKTSDLTSGENRRTEDPRKSLDLTGTVRSRIIAFQEKINAKKVRAAPSRVRRTFDDCCAVRVILRGYAVRADERDVSMHGGFKEELASLLGPRYGGCKLPRVFANGRYLGGVEEIRQLHDAGELRGDLGGLRGGGEGEGRLLPWLRRRQVRPCEACSGSCKVYVEEEDATEYGGFRRCPECNENGLVRCPVCCAGQPPIDRAINVRHLALGFLALPHGHCTAKKNREMKNGNYSLQVRFKNCRGYSIEF
ncbi:unnamed protein product [Spirodela intermedia]|uniref:Glutaredoxin domain-containing protein n=1 Tax=Spirodela intermedia TaxID=51605 RepID=A0A7I8IGL8_SPIIN|nr:unnamed protein product [Spirodela intermedia]CAA6656931.1 unnamed protein product [Spirodela intermedia]